MKRCTKTALQRSPNPGAFTATTFRTPRSRLTTWFARASFSKQLQQLEEETKVTQDLIMLAL
ncbi:MAG: hypothetical protein DSM106950_35955 [Stigonema ocellatum SAG 48.90 = DSM 106950]|nr:hypothetical protein [Stigonema ocellatum SAG 48.90 = DSM 106950]